LAAAAREYELVLMLDPGRDAPARDAIARQAREQIESAGTLKHQSDWGLRKLAYEIDRCNEADYRWFRFEAPSGVLEELDHNLKIADGVLRFRVFRVDAKTPTTAPPATSAPGPGASRERPEEETPGEEGHDREAEAPPPAPPAAPAEESPAAPAPVQAPAAEPPGEASEEPPAEPGE
jgi:small subunit ribosomal protein S6